MATNGYVYDRGHKILAAPTWVDPVLQGSNDINDIAQWTSASDVIIAYATAADVVIVNSTDAVQVGYATLANGFNSVIALGDYLYMGCATGVFRLDISAVNMQIENGDITRGGWTAYIDSGTAPDIPNDVVLDVHGWTAADTDEYLAVISQTGTGMWDKSELSIVNISDGVAYDATVGLSTRFAEGTTGKQIYVIDGNFVNVLYDAEAVAADSFWMTTAVGTVADALTDNDQQGWNYSSDATAGSTAVEQNARIELTVKTTADGTKKVTNAERSCWLIGDFDICVQFEIPALPTLTADGRYVTTGLTVSTASTLATIYRMRTRIGGVSYDKLGYWTAATGEVLVNYSETTFWLRAIRSGSDLSLYYDSNPVHDLASDLIVTLAAWGDGKASFYAENACTVLNDCSEGDWAHTAYINELDFVSAPAIYSTLPEEDEITGAAVTYETSTNDTSTLFAVSDGNLYVVDTDESTPNTSEADGTVDAAITGTYDLVATSTDATWTGSTGVGEAILSDVIRVSPGIDEQSFCVTEGSITLTNTFTTTSGQALVKASIQAMSVGSSFVYGSGGGGGWISPDLTAPAETDIDLRAELYTHTMGWVAPTEVDYDYTYIKRRSNGGAWSTFLDDGFGGVGSTVEFDDDHNGFRDDSLAVGDKAKIEYAVIHVNEAGNESSGEDAAGNLPTFYMDNPVITTVEIEDGDTSTDGNGVNVTVAGHSGTNSGSTTIDPTAAGMAELMLSLREAGGVWSQKQIFSPSVDYDVKLTNTEGAKTVEAKLYAQGGLVSSSDSDTIYVGADVPTAATSEEEKWILGGSFRSDDSDVDITAKRVVGVITPVSFDAEDSDYPLSNLQDVRLGVKASVTIPGSATDYTYIQFDLKTITHWPTYLMIGGHNLDKWAGYGHTVDVGYSPDNVAWTWTNINALAAYNWVFLDINTYPVNTIQYLRVRVTLVGGLVAVPTTLTFGRIIIACAADYKQPTYNMSEGIRFGPSYDGVLHTTPGARYAANEEKPYRVELALSQYSAADRNAVLSVLLGQGRAEPCMLLLRPSRIPTFNAGGNVTDTYPGKLKQAMYAWCDNAEVMWSSSPGDHWSTQLNFTESIDDSD